MNPENLTQNYVTFSDLQASIAIYVGITIGAFIVLSILAVFLQNFLNRAVIKQETEKLFKMEKKGYEKKISLIKAQVCRSMVTALGSYRNSSATAFLWALRGAVHHSEIEEFSRANEDLEVALNYLSISKDFKKIMQSDFSAIGRVFDNLNSLKKCTDLNEEILSQIDKKFDEKYKGSIS